MEIFCFIFIEFINCHTQSALYLNQDSEERCVHWIFYLTLWILAGIILINNCLLSIWCKEKVIFDSFGIFLD